METLYIKITDGQPEDHPLLESNLRLLVGDFDSGTVPTGYSIFRKSPLPQPDPLEAVNTTYVFNGVFTAEVHTLVPRTFESEAELRHALLLKSRLGKTAQAIPTEII